MRSYDSNTYYHFVFPSSARTGAQRLLRNRVDVQNQAGSVGGCDETGTQKSLLVEWKHAVLPASYPCYRWAVTGLLFNYWPSPNQINHATLCILAEPNHNAENDSNHDICDSTRWRDKSTGQSNAMLKHNF